MSSCVQAQRARLNMPSWPRKWGCRRPRLGAGPRTAAPGPRLPRPLGFAPLGHNSLGGVRVWRQSCPPAGSGGASADAWEPPGRPVVGPATLMPEAAPGAEASRTLTGWSRACCVHTCGSRAGGGRDAPDRYSRADVPCVPRERPRMPWAPRGFSRS